MANSKPRFGIARHASHVAATLAVALALIPGGILAATDETLCKGSDLSTAKSALLEAKSGLDKAIAAIDSGVAKGRLKTWFGTESPTDSKVVRDTLAKARVFVDGATFLCAVNTNVKIGDVYAYVRPDKSFAIVLGAFFVQAPVSGFNSKPGVLIHEMTHFVLAGATKDNVYGVDGAKQLAASSPKAALKNADNYEYFVEATMFNL